MKTNAKIEALRKTHAAKLKQAQDIRAAEGYASLDDKSQKTEAAAQVDGLIAELDAVNGEIAVEVRLQTEADEAARAQGQPVPDPRVEEGKNELVLKDADLRNISTDEAKARKDAVFAAWGARCASGEAGERNYLAANPAAAKLVRLARAVAAADKARSLMGADATEQGIMDVVNVMTSDTATSGGEIVPTEVAAEVLRHLQVLSPVRQIADVRSLSMLATVDVGIITQTGHAAALVDEKDEGADSPAARDLPTASNLMRPAAHRDLARPGIRYLSRRVRRRRDVHHRRARGRDDARRGCRLPKRNRRHQGLHHGDRDHRAVGQNFRQCAP